MRFQRNVTLQLGGMEACRCSLVELDVNTGGRRRHGKLASGTASREAPPSARETAASAVPRRDGGQGTAHGARGMGMDVQGRGQGTVWRDAGWGRCVAHEAAWGG
jgi:hypothetical protein